MDTIDTLLSQVARAIRKPDASTPCPSVEDLADFAAGRLPGPVIEALEAHLADCALCLDLVMLSRGGELDDPDPVRVPERVLEGVRGLVVDSSPWAVALRLVSGGLELLRQTGALLNARPLAVRGAEAAVAPADHYMFSREFPPYIAQFSVQRQEAAQVVLTLSLERSNGPLRSLQVELWQGERLRGVRTGIDGSVSFSGIAPGDYRINLLVGEQEVGQVHLTLQQ